MKKIKETVISQSIEPTELKVVRIDWAMKSLLRNKANFDILEGFLSELLKEKIKIESLLESESNQEQVEYKFNRVDLLVNTAKKEKIIIEVQVNSEWDFFHRILFGTSKVVTEYISKGQKYGQIPRVISVNILFFNLGVGSDYVYKGTTDFFGIHKNDKLELNDHSVQMYLKEQYRNINQIAEIFPTYYLIQLKKFTNLVKDKFDQWVYMLKNETIRSDFDAQGIKSAAEKLDVLKMKESEKKLYDKFWEDVSLAASLAASQKIELYVAEEKGRKKGIKEGLKKGIKEGRKEVALTIAKSLLSVLDNKTIAEKTGLTLQEIQKLRSKT